MKKFTNVNEIEQWLYEHNIKKYSINDKLIVDVDNDVVLEKHDISYFPFQFGIIDGVFDCSHNELSSLWGSPKIVKYGFNCSYNNLKSLEFGPKMVNGIYDAHNNKIENLQFLPQKFESLNLKNNKLTSLKGLPDTIEGFLDVANNELVKFDASTKTINGFFDCARNKFYTLENFPNVKEILIIVNNSFTNDEIFKLKSSFSTLYVESIYFENIAEKSNITLDMVNGEALIPHHIFKVFLLQNNLPFKDRKNHLKI